MALFEKSSEKLVFARGTSTKRIEKNLVDPMAMREAIINCIVHNDFTREIPPVFEIFSDRIVMTSYGGLIQGQSEEISLAAVVCREIVS